MENNITKGAQLMDGYLQRAQEERFSSEDIVGIFVPILEELERVHAQEKIALGQGLRSFDLSETGRLILNEASVREIRTNLNVINRILPDDHSSFDIISEVDMVTHISDQRESNTVDRAIHQDDDDIVAPVFLQRYISFETVLGHHDPLTDLHTLGLYMASLSFGIDLRDKDKTRVLKGILNNPAYGQSRVHPNILSVILDMVELDRRKRIRDAYTARIRLENYLEFNAASQEDFDQVIEQYKASEGDRTEWILSKLRNRLFDLSRRNRLIYFKKSSRYVNLTVSSVPYVLDYKNIRADKLFLWNEDIAKHLKQGENIKLNKYLKVRENPQILTSLKKIYYEGNRDKTEFGFNQLKLSFCFLNWYNFKENASDKIVSPLLLIPVSLKKKKGINDEFTLVIEDTRAQVNPVLSYYLKELYDIRLPKEFDLTQVDIDQIFDNIKLAVVSKSNMVDLEMVKKPRLRLIHSLAKRTFEAYQKKIKKSVTRSIWGNGDYSYQSSDYRPLGLKLFKERIAKSPSMLEFLIDPSINMTHEFMELETKKELYRLENDGSINPYIWEFDLCNFTLGNFNYQRMTLVNDYDSLSEEGIDNSIFERLFSKDPKEEFTAKDVPKDLVKNYSVIPADPTQLDAIHRADEEQSYIIQGPPGTGKSQTIANLLASQAVKGKSVLFISEKRAALDVVYARMSQIGLQDICTLIHDSQSDKKAFIFNVKDTYDKYSKGQNELQSVLDKRNEVVKQIDEAIRIIERFHSYQQNGKGDLKIRVVIDELLTSRETSLSFDPKLLTIAPDYGEWKKYMPLIRDIEASIRNSGVAQGVKSYPFMAMNVEMTTGDASTKLLKTCDSLEQDLNLIISKIKRTLTDDIPTVTEVMKVIRSVGQLAFLDQKNILDILNDHSELAVEYRKHLEEVARMSEELSAIREKNIHWNKKPTKEELRRMHQKYAEASKGFFNMLTGKKAKFKEMLSQFYDFSAHMIPPEPEEVFQNMQKELHLVEAIKASQKKDQVSKYLHFKELDSHKENFAFLTRISGNPNLLNDQSFLQFLEDAVEWQERSNSLQKELDLLAPGVNKIDDVYDRIDEIRLHIPSLFSLAPRVKEWYQLPEDIRSFALHGALSLEDCTRISAYKFLTSKDGMPGAEITGGELKSIVEKLGKLYPQFQKLNSRYVEEVVKKKFQDALDLNYIPSYELSEEQSEKKKSYREGRAVLENEFNKKIRYKSIRELAEGDTGIVIRDLKPIWMMSPLSVSDTLPLKKMFDLVIFDEASQITVEEGVPPLFRAEKAIIVGDEKQMPPSDFFSTKVDETEEGAEFLSLDADSLLNQGARKLPQVTLGWHYRSRKEALINFSNFAFYQGGLMSIPDVEKPEILGDNIEVFEREDAKTNLPKLLEGSITFHYLPNGIYHNRMNDDEADYIAHLTREILLSNTKKTVGIVAFSMQQQGNIETALTNLAVQDHKFAIALEEAYAGDDKEEFTGLFVKNLENVQGDERDIMILSICYGYSPKRRMLMNFGPINRRGGERRLNVIFSRAKYHMAVVSSIKHTDITNEYNEGANYLKKYLQYAECISKGNDENAQGILERLGGTSHTKNQENTAQSIVKDLQEVITEKGYWVTSNLGQSRLKIDIGIKKEKDSPRFDLGVVIDHREKYMTKDLLSEYYMKPTILEAFGWNILSVYAIDWLRNRNLVIETILMRIKGSQSMRKVVDDDSKIYKGTHKTLSIQLVHEMKNTFWTIELTGKEVKVTLGNVGSSGVESIHYFESEEEAKRYMQTQIENRQGRGFRALR